MNTNSVSKLYIILEIKNKFKIKCELKRHLAPTLVGSIKRSLPLSGHVHILDKSGIYFDTSIDAGHQRTKREFKKSDITFLSVGNAICFFYGNSKTRKEMSLIGKMLDDPELLKTVIPGDEIMFYADTG